MLNSAARKVCRAVHTARPELDLDELEALAGMVLPTMPVDWLQATLEHLADCSRELGHDQLINPTTRSYAEHLAVEPAERAASMQEWIREYSEQLVRRKIFGEASPC